MGKRRREAVAAAKTGLDWEDFSATTAPARDVDDSEGEEEEAVVPKANVPSSSGAVTGFERYYRTQKVLTQEEWPSFLSHLRQPLPVTFRVSRSEQCRGRAMRAVENARPLLKAAKAIYIPWLDAWQLQCTQRSLKEEHKELHEWVVANNKNGLITRQEVVSMVPVALLDVRPGHAVLDMCAAPGSKSTQALEALHQSLSTEAAGPVEAGLLVANDAKDTRAYVLAKRLKALDLCAARAIVTLHEAQHFPNVEERVEGEGGLMGPGMRGVYDRIVCDVPCSGDGALRKSVDTWNTFHPDSGLELHALQLQIALRAAALLKKGGMMTYSTCSFNPLENEAVVAALLEKTEGALEVVDASGLLGECRRAPGITDWKVMADDYFEVPNFEEGSRRRGTVKPAFTASMWPSFSRESVKEQLPRCMRFYSHHQNTGGFFVALIRKVEKLPRPPPPIKLIAGRRGAGNQNHFFFSLPDTVWSNLKAFFGLDDQMRDLLFSRSRECNSISLVGNSIRKHCLSSLGSSKLHVVWSGLSLFKSQKKKEQRGGGCGYFITQEGAGAVGKYMSRQKVVVEMADLRLLIDRRGALVGLRHLSPALKAAIAKLEHGPCLLSLSQHTIHVAALFSKSGSSLVIHLAPDELENLNAQLSDINAGIAQSTSSTSTSNKATANGNEAPETLTEEKLQSSITEFMRAHPTGYPLRKLRKKVHKFFKPKDENPTDKDKSREKIESLFADALVHSMTVSIKL